MIKRLWTLGTYRPGIYKFGRESMGGFGSSRWEATVTRATTAGLPRLDVRTLARAGALRAGTAATVTWGEGATVVTEVAHNDPDHLTLRYRACVGYKRWAFVQESVSLTRTLCTYGGERVWFVCPGCRSRCALFYALGGCFHCRSCHRLAYASTRRPAKQFRRLNG
jgi:hypothetical protein